MLAVHRFPVVDRGLVDAGVEAEIEDQIELTRAIRRWRDLVGVAAGGVLPARVAAGGPPHELVGRLARLDFNGGAGEPLATVGRIEILASDEIDPEQARRRIEERRGRLRAEVERGERKLANEGFVAKAPPEVVAEEREKLEGYRAELEELDRS
jgi:valyl-tRNA synthetase